MATNTIAFLPISGGSNLKSRVLGSSKRSSLCNTSRLTYQRKSNQPHTKKLSVRAEYNDGKGGEGEFVVGFLLGVGLCGSAAYMFAPQIKKALLRENDYGFMRPKGPIYEETYYYEGFEKNRNTLNAKIGQLISAIDNIYSRLRGGNKTPPIPSVHSDADEFTV